MRRRGERESKREFVLAWGLLKRGDNRLGGPRLSKL